MSYNTLKSQEAFLILPEEDRNILISHHHELANQLNGTQDAINATIEAKPEAKEKDPNIVELDNENYGAPPENSGIAAYKKGMKSPNASYTEPQAWEDEQ